MFSARTPSAFTLSLSLIASVLVFAPASFAQVDVTVNGDQGPWLVTGTLNAAYPYNQTFDNNEAAPTVVTSSSQVSIDPGQVVSINYVSGTVSVQPGTYPYTNSGGNTAIPENNSVVYGSNWPSYWIPAAQYPVYSTELIATFADASGAIVGTPFAAGLSDTVTVPAGATQLQLGVNDTNYSDNAGSWTIGVSNVVPEPTSLGLLAIGGLLAMRPRNRRTA
ncbi:MAG TPA: PEP-CTERM sorting domain-containing protein [Tepidisphaeraceae bacterium]|nr:PEP-CTERM sorting domain-containing protein [Tepidisphaeraceae bacterium]